MSTCKLSSQRQYWQKQRSAGPKMPWFGRVMARNRFERLRRALHFNNNAQAHPVGSPGFDKLFKLRPIIDALKESFAAAWTLGARVSVDEAMVAYKGRTYLRQYLPKKVVKWGFKIWMMACASTGYCYALDVEAGVRPGEAPRKELGPKVVKDLTEGLRPGTTIYADRFFSSIQLALDLLERGHYYVGTIMPNRKGVPKGATFKKGDRPARGDKLSAVEKDKGLRFVTWCDNQKVSFISTVHAVVATVDAKRKGKDAAGRR